jgi:Big-like domain-containing protein
MHRFLTFCVAVAALAAGACSNDNTTTTPTTPTPTASISPATTVYQIGQTQTFTLTATTTPTNVTWTSSNTDVLMIDSAGNATAVGVGTATITSSADSNLSATLAVQVVPIYQGNWAGTARVLACTDVAGFLSAGYCARNVGAVNTVTLSLTQSGGSISGSITKSEGANLLNGSIGGTIGAGGDVTFTGTLAGLANGSNLQLTVVTWNSLATGATMTGTWAGNITSPQILGIATLQWSLTMQKAN